MIRGCILALPASFVLWAILLNVATALGVPPIITVGVTVVGSGAGLFWLDRKVAR